MMEILLQNEKTSVDFENSHKKKLHRFLDVLQIEQIF